MNLLISTSLAVCIILYLTYSFIYVMLLRHTHFHKQKAKRYISLDEAISRVRSGDGWLVAYDDYDLWENEFFWLQSDIPPDHIFDLERLIRTKAYYVVRQNSFQDVLNQIDNLVRERFCVCHYYELRDPE